LELKALLQIEKQGDETWDLHSCVSEYLVIEFVLTGILRITYSLMEIASKMSQFMNLQLPPMYLKHLNALVLFMDLGRV
jgi:hypothetical protein